MCIEWRPPTPPKKGKNCSILLFVLFNPILDKNVTMVVQKNLILWPVNLSSVVYPLTSCLTRIFLGGGGGARSIAFDVNKAPSRSFRRFVPLRERLHGNIWCEILHLSMSCAWAPKDEPQNWARPPPERVLAAGASHDLIRLLNSTARPIWLSRPILGLFKIGPFDFGFCWLSIFGLYVAYRWCRL